MRQGREQMVSYATPSLWTQGRAGQWELGGNSHWLLYKIKDFQAFNSEALGFRRLETPPRVSLPPSLPLFSSSPPPDPPAFSFHARVFYTLEAIFPYWCWEKTVWTEVRGGREMSEWNAGLPLQEKEEGTRTHKCSTPPLYSYATSSFFLFYCFVITYFCVTKPW